MVKMQISIWLVRWCMVVLFDLYDMLECHCDSVITFSVLEAWDNTTVFLLRTLRPSILLFTLPLYSVHYIHCFCPLIMKFIVSLNRKENFLYDLCVISWPSPFSVLSHNNSFLLDPASVFAFIKRQLARYHRIRIDTAVSSLCKFAVMTSKALVALLAVVVASISESPSQNTFYQATGSCQVE